MRKYIIISGTNLLLLLFMVVGCSTTGYHIEEPHFYTNSYNDVIKSVQLVLTQEGMKIDRSEIINENTYRIYFYKKTTKDYNTGSRNTVTIKKLASSRASIQIIEDKGFGLEGNVHTGRSARGLFTALDKVLLLEPKEEFAAE